MWNLRTATNTKLCERNSNANLMQTKNNGNYVQTFATTEFVPFFCCLFIQNRFCICNTYKRGKSSLWSSTNYGPVKNSESKRLSGAENESNEMEIFRKSSWLQLLWFIHGNQMSRRLETVSTLWKIASCEQNTIISDIFCILMMKITIFLPFLYDGLDRE